MLSKIVHIGWAAAALFFMATSAQAAIIMSPTDASASSTRSESLYSIRYAIDQSGLSATIRGGKANLDPYLARGPLHGVSSSRKEWFSANGATTARLWFDLGAVEEIMGVVVWNEESNGFGTAAISTSVDGAAFAALGSISPHDNGLGADPAEAFTLIPTLARYVALDLSGCPQGATGGSYDGCALGEIAFVVEGEIAAVPVPAAAPLLLGALGLFGWAGRRRA
jgi:hypothetical protein